MASSDAYRAIAKRRGTGAGQAIRKTQSVMVQHYRHWLSLRQLATASDLTEHAQQRLLTMLDRCEQEMAEAPIQSDEALLVALKYLLEQVQEEFAGSEPTVGEAHKVAMLSKTIRYVGQYAYAPVGRAKKRPKARYAQAKPWQRLDVLGEVSVGSSRNLREIYP
jgi:hypothetical protein